MATIDNFIQQNYDVIYQSPSLDRADQADEFLLADVHCSAGHEEINTSFINAFADKDGLVLTEAVSSMEPIHPNEATQTKCLKDSTKIVGWDIGDIGTIVNPTFQKIAKPSLKADLLLKKLLETDSLEEQREIKEKLHKLSNKIYYASLGLKPDSLDEAVGRTFPSRVESMEKSMKQAAQISPRRFIIAGKSHLDPKGCSIPGTAEKVEEFQKFLDSRKAVILVPKQAKVEKTNQASDERIRTIFEKLRD